MKSPCLPPVSDQQRAQAFERMAWVDCTLQQALAHPIRSRCIEVLARQIRTAQWMRQRLAGYAA